jgi:hypothetical protein
MVQTDDFGASRFIRKMTGHRIFDHGAQVVPVFALGEDAVAERARPIAAFVSLTQFHSHIHSGPPNWF